MALGADIEFVEGSKAARTFTQKDAANIAVPKKFAPAVGTQLTPAEAAGRIAKLGAFIDWFFGILAVGLFAGGLIYWAIADDNFERSEMLPFPFVAGAMALFALWFFRRRRGAWPAKLVERARDCQPPGPISVGEDGLTFSGKMYSWASLTMQRVSVIVRNDDTSWDYLINRLTLKGADGPFSLDVFLMRDGQPIVNAVYLKLKPLDMKIR
jgi:hypothetical protein